MVRPGRPARAHPIRAGCANRVGDARTGARRGHRRSPDARRDRIGSGDRRRAGVCGSARSAVRRCRIRDPRCGPRARASDDRPLARRRPRGHPDAAVAPARRVGPCRAQPGFAWPTGRSATAASRAWLPPPWRSSASCSSSRVCSGQATRALVRQPPAARCLCSFAALAIVAMGDLGLTFAVPAAQLATFLVRAIVVGGGRRRGPGAPRRRRGRPRSHVA